MMLGYEQQRAIFKKYRIRAWASTIFFLVWNVRAILRAADERYDRGYLSYGSAMFFNPKLRNECLEEAADLVDYKIADLWRKHHG